MDAFNFNGSDHHYVGSTVSYTHPTQGNRVIDYLESRDSFGLPRMIKPTFTLTNT